MRPVALATAVALAGALTAAAAAADEPDRRPPGPRPDVESEVQAIALEETVYRLFSSGSPINGLGTGVSGADESILQNLTLGMSTFGFGHQVDQESRVADDFTVTDLEWFVDHVLFYSYETGALTSSTITEVNLRIWDGPPEEGGVVIWGDTTTNRLRSSRWSGAYRVSEETTGQADDRAIMENEVEVGTTLPAGTYWLDWQARGDPDLSGPWAPPITEDGNTTTGNGLQSRSGDPFEAAMDVGTLTPQGFPFVIHGTRAVDSIPPPEETHLRTADGGSVIFYCSDPVVPPVPADEVVQAVWRQVFIPALDRPADGSQVQLFAANACDGEPILDELVDSDLALGYGSIETDPLEPGAYCWRARAWDGAEIVFGSWSSCCCFEVVATTCQQLEPPQLTAVGEGGCGGTTRQPSPLLSWSAVANASGYQWEIRTDRAVRVDLGETGIDGTSATPSVSLSPGIYVARANAVGDGEDFCSSFWSPDCAFEVLPPAVADFSWWPEEPKQGERVRFVDRSTEGAAGWAWSLGDGQGSSRQHPTHVYQQTGDHAVELEVSYPSEETRTVQNTVVVSGEATCGNLLCESFETAWSCPEDCALDPGTTGRNGASDRRPTVPAAVGGVPGVGDTFWMTEGTVYNPGPATAQVILEYTRRDANSILEAGPFELEPEQGMYWESAVSDLFGVTDAGALWLDSSEPVLFVTRSYNATSGEPGDGGPGTFGQGVSGTAERLTIGQGDGEIYLIGLRDDDAFRSNLFLQEVDGEAVTARIKVHDTAGNVVRQIWVEVPGHSSRSRSLGALVGEHIDSAYVTCEVVTGDGRLAVVGSVVDNASTDPTTIDPLHPAQLVAGIAEEVHDVVAVVAHTPGAEDTFWRSTLTIVNPLPQRAQSLHIHYLPERSGQPIVEILEIQPRQQLAWQDVLVGLFGYPDTARTAGSLHLYSPAGVMIDSRSYNQTPVGATLGQKIPALRIADMIGVGETGAIIGLQHSAQYRTNLGFTESSGVDTEIDLVVFSYLGGFQTLHSTTVLVPASSHLQLQRVFDGLGLEDTVGIGALVSVRAGGAVYAYASAVDNRTGDATTYTAAR